MESGRIIILGRELCRTPAELIGSALFRRVLERFLALQYRMKTKLTGIVAACGAEKRSPGGSVTFDVDRLCEVLTLLMANRLEDVAARHPDLVPLSDSGLDLQELVEELYNFWRKTERFVVMEETFQAANIMTRDYHNWFIQVVQSFEDLVRETYRRISYNASGELPKIYRQLPSGAGAGLLVERIPWNCPPEPFRQLAEIPLVQLVVIEPPLIYYPRRNFREGTFKKVDYNPLAAAKISKDEWYCFPAKVGLLLIFIYFRRDFLSLGTSLSNLFEIAQGDEVMERKPDGIVAFGLEELAGGDSAVFCEDEASGLVVGGVRSGDDVDYFGYLKKMTLTLHNAIMINRGMLPLHGAMAHLVLRDGRPLNLLLVGDSGAGKSESLEALRDLAAESLSQFKIIFDDMGVIGIDDAGRLQAYGTEIGAFVRLDDLKPGYAYSEIDRSIFMNPQLNNARVVIPVSTHREIIRGYPVDLFLYANNYEEVNEEQPVLGFFDDPERALEIFRSGARMAKGTTDERGLIHTYFANPFGAPQKKDQHEAIARAFFKRMAGGGVRLGQLRTRLGIPGYESAGPDAAARAILEYLAET